MTRGKRRDTSTSSRSISETSLYLASWYLSREQECSTWNHWHPPHHYDSCCHHHHSYHHYCHHHHLCHCHCHYPNHHYLCHYNHHYHHHHHAWFCCIYVHKSPYTVELAPPPSSEHHLHEWSRGPFPVPIMISLLSWAIRSGPLLHVESSLASSSSSW